jgi:hypothetical protein
LDNRNSGALAQSPALRWMLRISRLEDSLFTGHRLKLWGSCLLAAYVIAFAIRFFEGSWMIDKLGHPAFKDFLWMWIGGRFALARNATGAFNYSVFSAAQASLIAHAAPPGGFPYFYWVYPPTLLILLAPFALLPYLFSFFVWMAITACLYLAAIYIILPGGLSVLLALLPCTVLMNVSVGQGAFLTAGLLGLSFIFMRRRPYLSGFLLGLLTYKPQFGVLFPIVLVITRQWRVIAGAVASALLFAGAATLLFGINAWVLFLQSIHAHNPATFQPTYALEAMNQTVFGFMHWIGADLKIAWVAHLTVTFGAGALACWIWLRRGSYSLKAAAFSLAALLATPYMLVYDLTALSIPAAFMIEDGRARGFLPGERLILLGCFLGMFLWNLLPIGPIIMLAMMVTVLRRASYEDEAGVHERSGAVQPEAGALIPGK